MADIPCTSDSDCTCMCSCGTSGYYSPCDTDPSSGQCQCYITYDPGDGSDCEWICNWSEYYIAPDCDGSNCPSDCQACGVPGIINGKCCDGQCVNQSSCPPSQPPQPPQPPTFDDPLLPCLAAGIPIWIILAEIPIDIPDDIFNNRDWLNDPRLDGLSKSQKEALKTVFEASKKGGKGGRFNPKATIDAMNEELRKAREYKRNARCKPKAPTKGGGGGGGPKTGGGTKPKPRQPWFKWPRFKPKWPTWPKITIPRLPPVSLPRIPIPRIPGWVIGPPIFLDPITNPGTFDPNEDDIFYPEPPIWHPPTDPLPWPPNETYPIDNDTGFYGPAGSFELPPINTSDPNTGEPLIFENWEAYEEWQNHYISNGDISYGEEIQALAIYYLEDTDDEVGAKLRIGNTIFLYMTYNGYIPIWPMFLSDYYLRDTTSIWVANNFFFQDKQTAQAPQPNNFLAKSNNGNAILELDGSSNPAKFATDIAEVTPNGSNDSLINHGLLELYGGNPPLTEVTVLVPKE